MDYIKTGWNRFSIPHTICKNKKIRIGGNRTLNYKKCVFQIFIHKMPITNTYKVNQNSLIIKIRKFVILKIPK